MQLFYSSLFSKARLKNRPGGLQSAGVLSAHKACANKPQIFISMSKVFQLRINKINQPPGLGEPSLSMFLSALKPRINKPLNNFQIRLQGFLSALKPRINKPLNNFQIRLQGFLSAFKPRINKPLNNFQIRLQGFLSALKPRINKPGAKKAGLFAIGASLWLFPLLLSAAESPNGSDLLKAAMHRDIPSYRQKMRQILQLPSSEALRRLSDNKEEKSFFEVFIFSNREALISEGINFIAAFSPPLGKRNAQGKTARKEAFQAKNYYIYQTLNEWNNQASYELHEISTDFWNLHIPVVSLENSALAKALESSDWERFQKEAAILMEEKPLSEWLGVWHARTSQGGTLFHIAAKAEFKEGDEKKFAQSLQQLIERTLPSAILQEIQRRNNYPEKRWLRRALRPELMEKGRHAYTWMNYGLILAGLSIIDHSWESPDLNIGMGLAGAGLCLLTFQKRHLIRKKWNPAVKN